MLTNSPSSAALLLRLVGLGGGTGGCLAWGGTGGGVSAESAEGGVVKEARGGSSPIRDTVLGGLATAMGTEDEEEEEEDDEEEEEGVGLLPGSEEDVVRNFGGSRACLGRGRSCGVFSIGEGLWTNWTPADSTGLHTKQTNIREETTATKVLWLL